MVTEVRRCRAMVMASSRVCCGPVRLGSGCGAGGDETLPELSDAGDVADELVAGGEPAPGVSADAHPRGRAREEHVTGQQRELAGERRDHGGHGEDEVAGAALLHLLAVDRAGELQVVPIVKVVRADEPRPHRPEPGQLSQPPGDVPARAHQEAAAVVDAADPPPVTRDVVMELAV